MSAKQVLALEAADYATVPTGTFLRGFVRAYAKQVHCDPDHAIALLESSHTHTTVVNAASIVTPSQNIKLARGEAEVAARRTRYVIVAIVLFVTAVISFYWWQYVRPYRNEGGRPPADRVVSATSSAGTAPTAAAAAPQLDAAVGSAALPSATAEPESAKSAASTPAMPTSATELANAAASGTHPVSLAPLTASTNPAPLVSTQTLGSKPVVSTPPLRISEPERVPAKGEGMLGFTFTGESWVEVVDGAGKTVLSRRFRAGDVGEAIGRAPMSIVIGNAPATRMAFNGREFDLAPHTRVAVARVTVK